MKAHNKLIGNRLMKYRIDEDLLAYEQIGFMPDQQLHYHTSTLVHIYTSKITNLQLYNTNSFNDNNIDTDSDDSASEDEDEGDDDDNINTLAIQRRATERYPNHLIEIYLAFADFSKVFDTIDI